MLLCTINVVCEVCVVHVLLDFFHNFYVNWVKNVFSCRSNVYVLVVVLALNEMVEQIFLW